ncbi:N-acetylmuramic acid 6-phosphate etherase [Paludifilum halophilum]|uniref:N-acetylmuramic acid 6-phosphate etherase n=1 Tax=Paludifilum halophilum TaxID=1642702 RepID=A0A235B6M5_9BACL|nr:N-acetylmuramic acid 6-phosphate etherase [Paludifilum halophilum]OYD07954.1 N-acetylmuramic acid 6-phosphate etherase [Paludifilum halophilum]
MEKDLSHLRTEQINESTRHLDRMSSLEIVQAMNREDFRVPQAVEKSLSQVARTVEEMVKTVKGGGRIFYIGAGTSGRLGILDASECPPTFSTDPELVQGIIAGGEQALRFAVEGVEDSMDRGKADLQSRNFSSCDFLVGIAASGRTPYVLGALQYARQIGAGTASITCNPGSRMGQWADVAIEVDTGSEVLQGSTRLKSGTAQKMILNMLSTATMVRLGKAYQNLMVDLNPSNQKLEERSRRIIRIATGATREEVEQAYRACEGETKTAIVTLLTGTDPETARKRLHQAEGRVSLALDLDNETRD